jgi:hypothetical protein
MNILNIQQELFEPLPHDMIATHFDVSQKASKYFGTRPVTPNVYVAPELYSTDILGAYDPYNITIIYNPQILDKPRVRKKVVEHEAVHSVQPGLENLLSIYALYVEDGKVKYAVPIGRAIAEGSNELVLEKIGKGRTGAYEREYKMVKEIDKIIPIKYLHKLAESKPYELLKILNRPDVKQIIGKYVIGNYISTMYS